MNFSKYICLVTRTHINVSKIVSTLETSFNTPSSLLFYFPSLLSQISFCFPVLEFHINEIICMQSSVSGLFLLVFLRFEHVVYIICSSFFHYFVLSHYHTKFILLLMPHLGPPSQFMFLIILNETAMDFIYMSFCMHLHLCLLGVYLEVHF